MKTYKLIQTPNGSVAVDAVDWLESRNLLGRGEVEDSADEIRDHYRTLVAPPTYWSRAGFQGQGFRDWDAFDECCRDYGYVPTIRALKEVSERAKKKNAAYLAKRKANQR